MALANNRLTITELDFDLIKTNLQTFMQGQNTFSDYNFQGSGLQQLLNVLAYNTHYGAVYLNMLANELHISTALVRNNIIKLAKALNYVPGSMRSPSAFVNIIVTPPDDSVSTLLLPRYTPFQSQAIGGANYNYVTTSSYTSTLANGQFVFNSVEIQEGIVVNFNYTADPSNPRNSFNIPNANIDTNTLLVNVTENSPSPPTTIPYIITRDISLLDGNTRVYFLEGSDDSTYNLYFGDGVFGHALTSGDTISTTYLVTNGDASNQANNFTIMVPVGGFGNCVVQTITASGGGSSAETNSNIKFNAPLSYTTQERAVTIADYNFLLNRDYPNIGSFAMWGGDKNNPPIFGIPFISIKPKIGNYLSNLEKQNILNILSRYNMPTVIPRIVDPDYTYILVNAIVNYNPNLTTTSQQQLIANITNQIFQYATDKLGKFNGTYRQSVINEYITRTDPSILGVDSEIFLQKRFFPILGRNVSYSLYFNTPVHRGGLNEKLYSSPSFSIYDSFGTPQNCFIEENINTYQGITTIAVNNPGFNYTGEPKVNILGDGIGAQAHAVVVNGAIQSVVLDSPGEGYNFATTTITEGNGSGAVISPILAAETGILQTYYYTNTNKNILSVNQGTVDHISGVVNITNFNPIDINNLTKQLTINIKPESELIIPFRNNILLIDPHDPFAVTVTLVPQIV